MIHFPPLRTRRLTVQLRELTISESVAIASMPPHLEEAECTAFLRAAVQSAQGIEDPAQWTVQERMLAVCHYLASTSDDGPDFAIGGGHYSDYLDGATDIQTQAPMIELGELGGDTWKIQNLTGRMAESIERMEGEIQNAAGQPFTGRLHWILGGMAAQLVRASEDAPDAAMADGAFDEYLVERMRVMVAFPSSDFEVLMGMYLTGRQKLNHLFKIEFSPSGVLAMPKGGAAANLPPARFPVRTCLSRVALELVGKPDESGV